MIRVQAVRTGSVTYLRFAATCRRGSQANVTYENNTRALDLLVFFTVQTILPEHAARGDKCLNQYTRELITLMLV